MSPWSLHYLPRYSPRGLGFSFGICKLLDCLDLPGLILSK